jgi:hypothetical protein
MDKAWHVSFIAADTRVSELQRRRRLFAGTTDVADTVRRRDFLLFTVSERRQIVALHLDRVLPRKLQQFGRRAPSARQLPGQNRAIEGKAYSSWIFDCLYKDKWPHILARTQKPFNERRDGRVAVNHER